MLWGFVKPQAYREHARSPTRKNPPNLVYAMNTDHCAYKKAEARRQRQEHVCNDMSMSRESAQHDADCKHMYNPASAQEQLEQQSWKHMPRFNKNHKCSDMT